MKPRGNCGGKEFKIDAVVACTETIVIGDEPDFEDFELVRPEVANADTRS